MSARPYDQEADAFGDSLAVQTGKLAAMLGILLAHPDSEPARILGRQTLDEFQAWKQTWRSPLHLLIDEVSR